MNKLHNSLGKIVEECMINQIYSDMKETEGKWIEEYNSKTKIQKLVYNSKLNVEIMKNKNMKLKDKLSLIVLGA